MFELDDGSIPAHRAILTARCDMMKAMFSGDFRESSAKVVSKLRIVYFDTRGQNGRLAHCKCKNVA